MDYSTPGRPPCPSPTPGVHSNSRPLSRWYHPAISSSVVPFSSCPQSLPASVFSNESTLHMRWPKYWSFSFSIIPSKEHPGLISFRMDWLDLLGVQGTLKSLLQHLSSKASMLERVWRKGNPLSLLVGMQTSTATMENSVEIPLKTGNRTALLPSNPTARHTHRGKTELKEKHVLQCSLQHCL